ncbi:MAG: protein kinase [Acidobacteria bacterium]|nr:protein kinase [Acidobacteriota bacterium]
MEEPGRELEAFEGTRTLSLGRRLGAGSFGTVYQAFDLARQTKVALKLLHHTTPEALYLFKREFRALADLVHPNLVMLYELTSVGNRWFFTMELVEGQSFLEYVRTPPGAGPWHSESHSPVSDEETWAATPLSEAPTRVSDPLASSGASREAPPGSTLPPASEEPPSAPQEADGLAPDLPRLRSALRQLAEGLSALHQAGKLHRDLKPGNIMVDADGRVVILDFGLVTDLGPDHSGAHPTRVFGTPSYMSPEQGAGDVISEASDWFSVGVVLYEALTGQRPFRGTSLDMIQRRQMEPLIAPDQLVPDLPRDLVRLCMDLLERRPAYRPSGAEVLQRLGTAPVPAPFEPQPALQRGREWELAELLQAFKGLQDGRPRTLALHGSSGMGKSHLLRRFLREVHRRDRGAVMLTGRCYEQESVPFKALDSLVDALSNHLFHLPEAEVKALLPRNPQALTRLFPVLRQVPAFEVEERGDLPDLLELRRRAFAALRELLARMGDQHPLILVIDDLQWGDLDSALLLEELLRPPDAPTLLLIFAFRSEEMDTSPVLLEMLPKLAAVTIELGPLPPDEARDLALACMGTQDRAAREQAMQIVQEAQGNPFFISQLARYTQRRELSAVGGVEQVVRAGVEALPPEARNLLEVISVAGQPLELPVIRKAAGLHGDGPLVMLRAGHMVRMLGSAAARMLEPYHDRIREAVLGTLAPAALSAHHRALALAFEATGRLDPEALVRHFEGAGEPGRAAVYAAQAGDRASGALAFERAARFYQKALELGAPQPQALRVKRGEALAHAGFGQRAGRAYLEAVEGATPEDAMHLKRLAADRFIRSGHFDEGIPILKELVKAVGLRWPTTRLQAIGSLLLHRIQLQLRGLRFEAREPHQIPAQELLRMEVCRVAAAGLSTVDPLRGIDFQTRHLLMALESGEPLNLARSLALETALRSAKGLAGAEVTARFQRTTLAHAERMGHPEALARAYVAAGIVASSEGRWNEVSPWMEKAQAIADQHPQALVYDIHFAHFYGLGARLTMGHFDEARRRLPALLQAARERGDDFARLHFAAAIAAKLHLADDAPQLCRSELAEAEEGWSRALGGFTMPDFYVLMTSIDADTYEGRPGEALARLARVAGPLKASGLLRVAGLNLTWHYLWALAALSAGPAHLPTARKAIAALEREKLAYGWPLAEQLRASAALLQGREAAALGHLRAAIPALERSFLMPQAHSARWALGHRIGGKEGKALLDQVAAWTQAQGIKRPDRYFRTCMPGIGDAEGKG